MPKLAKIVGNLITIPPNMAKAGWDFDVDCIRELCKEMGIKWNVKFRYSSARGNYGTARVKRNSDGSFYHAITISQVWNREEVVKTILHELVHAIQVERLGIQKFNEQYRLYIRSGNQYLVANPFEKEAEDFAQNSCLKWDGILY